MTPNGKLDRKALPAPPREETRPPANHPPETRLEREIAGIWEDLLQVSPIGVRSDFFDLGGDSLALVSLFATIEARFGRPLTVDVLAGGLTVAGLAQVLAEDEPMREDGSGRGASAARSSSAILLCSRDRRRRGAPAPPRDAYGNAIVLFSVFAATQKLDSPTPSVRSPRVTLPRCWFINPPDHSILGATPLARRSPTRWRVNSWSRDMKSACSRLSISEGPGGG